MLLDMHPEEISLIRDPEEFATEPLHHRQVFVALEAPSMNRETRAAWLDDYKLLLHLTMVYRIAYNKQALRMLQVSPLGSIMPPSCKTSTVDLISVPWDIAVLSTHKHIALHWRHGK
ncbi:hypothetical protein FOMPIDRAFT_1055144 [Fomitopsis schrenkii]|uniref:Uncharacterized protein n=1 Tax=Fomitopsis schrenkii TaxID=2126942 RepID=S8F650_FOMSC|nr:hypothetical protein FOMPIDRAFT_1055144 [Fomitopsis schrenkii]